MKRILGRSGIKVSALGMGCWAIGGPLQSGFNAVGWGEVDDNESVRALNRGIEMGINFIDTADVYGAGHSERIISGVIKGKRDKLIIATKFGNVFDEERKMITGQSAETEYIKSACEASLKRLSTDYIDLYQFHINNYDPEKAGEVADTLDRLVSDGKIRYYAWSTDYPDRVKIFAEHEKCTAIQHEFNIFNDNKEVVTLCEGFNLASINRGPLAMGLLSGKYNKDSSFSKKDVRGKNSPSWMKFFKKGKVSEELLSKLESVRDILTSDGRSLVQGALAWIWARSSNTIPIPGFRTEKQVKENAEAMEKGPLTEEQVTEISKIIS